MKYRYLLAFAPLALAACVGTPEVRATNALAIACDTYATALEQITPLRAAGSLSASQVARVSATNLLVDPACSTGSLLNPASAIQTVRAGIGLLNVVKGAF